MLHIKLVKSPIGNNARNRRIVVALGLRKLHQTVVHNDTPSIRGMVHRVKHMLEVKEGPAPELAAVAPTVAKAKTVKETKPKAEVAPKPKTAKKQATKEAE